MSTTFHPRVSFGVRDDVVPRGPRLIVRSYGREVYETGMLSGGDSRKVATAMIAAARLLHPFTDVEVLSIPRLSTAFEHFQATRGESMARIDGSTPANDAFSTFTTWPSDDEEAAP